jgi:hypothetical protein
MTQVAVLFPVIELSATGTSLEVQLTWFIGGRPELDYCIAVAPGSGFAWDSFNCSSSRTAVICEEGQSSYHA